MGSYYTAQPTPNSQPVNSKIQTDTSVNTIIGFCILIPMIGFAGFNIYKKHRAAVLRKQIASLEKLWHLNLKKKNI